MDATNDPLPEPTGGAGDELPTTTVARLRAHVQALEARLRIAETRFLARLDDYGRRIARLERHRGRG
jgi:hypothetical protein